ncbi:hypothetical protein [Sphingomonas ginkgonis]|uniref:hypothetical protein n=1 Tax=Sphingomonas ginkgonis TaxID=2315330 RepID=UPI00163A8FC2|nr:hypothetical protein [Sphingomonas ginkgonis]
MLVLLFAAAAVTTPLDVDPRCAPLIAREAKQVGAPLLHQLDRLPPAEGYRAVYHWCR